MSESNSIPHFYLLDANSILFTQIVTNQGLQALSNVYKGIKSSLSENQGETALHDNYEWIYGICFTELQGFLIITLKNEC